MIAHALTIRERIQRVAEHWLGERLADDQPLWTAELAPDPIIRVELLIGLEDEFDIEITDDEADACQTFADLVRLIETRAPEQAPEPA